MAKVHLGAVHDPYIYLPCPRCKSTALEHGYYCFNAYGVDYVQCGQCGHEMRNWPKRPPVTGVNLAVAEQRRQREKKGYTPEHDAAHTEGELAWHAMYYAMPHPIRHKCHCGASSFTTPDSLFEQTGFEGKYATRGTKTSLRRIVVAAALLLAEADRQIAQLSPEDLHELRDVITGDMS